MTGIFFSELSGVGAGVMRLRQPSGRLVMTVLLDFIKGVWMLPAPSSLTMDSVDMTHRLTWRPLQSPCNTTILYSVRFQGEFELVVCNGGWLDAAECQRVPRTLCDLTRDLGSDSDYNIHVRAQCGSELSPWSPLVPPFNRRHTVLTVPKMWVTTAGDVLQVTFDGLPLTVDAHVAVWKKGNELQAAVYTMPAEQPVLQVPGLQEGAEYCVSAQAVLQPDVRSNRTDARCVSITASGKEAPWKTPTTVTAAVIVMAGILFAVFWSIVHCRPHQWPAYFHKQRVNDIHVLMSPEETEDCERIHVLHRDKD